MTTLSALLASTFGHGSNKPVRTALLKLAGLWAGSLSVGLLVSQSLPSMAGAASFSWITWLAIFVVTAQIAVLLGLEVSSGIITTSSKLNLILGLLPLKKSKLNFFMMLPALILALCSLTLVLPSLVTICLAVGLHPIYLVVGFCTGGWSAFGMIYAHPNRRACLLLAIIVATGEYKILELLRADDTWVFAAMLFAIIGLLSMLALQAGETFRSLTRRPLAADKVSMGSLPTWMWFAKKLWRQTVFRRSFIVTLVLGSGLALFLTKYGQLGDSLVVLPIQLLAAALASDIRSAARSLMPPEIGALRGTLSFTAQSVVVGLGAVTLALLPVEIVAIVHDLPTSELLVGITFGTVIGLFVGVWLTPRTGDISAQLAANLACLCITLSFSQLISERYIFQAQCALIFVAIGSTFLIEYKRNALIWRKHGI